MTLETFDYKSNESPLEGFIHDQIGRKTHELSLAPSDENSLESFFKVFLKLWQASPTSLLRYRYAHGASQNNASQRFLVLGDGALNAVEKPSLFPWIRGKKTASIALNAILREIGLTLVPISRSKQYLGLDRFEVTEYEIRQVVAQ